MKIHTTIAVLLSAAVLTSCDALDEIEIKDLTAPSPPTARIKFNNFSVNSVQVNFFANDTKMTAVLITSCSPGVNASLPTVDSLKTKCLAGGIESATGTAFGGNAAGGLYMGIIPGSYTLTARKAATDTVISTVTQTIGAGKAYTFTMSGIYDATTKTAEAFVVEDPLPTGAIDYTVAHVRLINAVPNATGDLTMTVTNTSVTPNTSTVIGGATAYKAATAFFTVPEGTYTVTVRATGAATDLITRTGVSLSGSRIYTLTARGDATVASTRAFDYLENQR
jgi:hypothetical protein